MFSKLKSLLSNPKYTFSVNLFHKLIHIFGAFGFAIIASKFYSKEAVLITVVIAAILKELYDRQVSTETKASSIFDILITVMGGLIGILLK